MTDRAPEPTTTPSVRAAGATDTTGPGLLAGLGAYLLWGFMPLYFPLLEPAGPVEIIAHRVLWSLVLCALLLTLTRSWSHVIAAVRSPRALGTLAVAGVLVGTNWLVFVLAVLTGRTLEASLGYYINPLVTAALGVVVLGERLRPAQWVALGTAGGAVVVLTVGVGRPPWVALTLAATFGLYGLMKNRVGRTVDTISGLAVETAVLAPVALGYLLWLGAEGAWAGQGTGHRLLLASAGVVTAVPLLLFGAAARRLPLSVVGLLQYVTPTMQFLVGLLVMREPMAPARWWGFALVWLALVVLTTDSVRAARAERLRRAQPSGSTTLSP